MHLAGDVRTYGALDVFSAFRFDNHMSKLKKMLRKADKPLQQLSKRYSELENLQTNFIINDNLLKSKYKNLKRKHTKGPLDFKFSNSIINQYKHIITPRMSIKCDDKKNCFCLLKNGTIVYVKNILETYSNSNIYIVGYQIKICNPSNLYTNPCESEKLNIKIISDIKHNCQLKSWRLLMSRQNYGEYHIKIIISWFL